MAPIYEYFVKPGFLCVCRERCLLKTVVGSCVAVCLWDKVCCTGGMCHFVHPRRLNNQSTARYGDVAVRHLIRLSIAGGSKKRNLVAHLAGGCANLHLSSGIGSENILIAEKILRIHHIPVLTREVGGTDGRRVVFDTTTGDVQVGHVRYIREDDMDGED